MEKTEKDITTTEIITFHNPLYLHPSDSPHIILVSDPLKGIENYKVWSRQMIVALEAKNKLVFVDGSYTKPADTDDLYPQWKRCNALVLSWIHNVISSELLSGVVYCDLASSVWSELKERFDQTSGTEMFALLRQISTISQGSNSVSSYYSRLKKLWDEYESLIPFTSTIFSKEYVQYTQNLKTMQFLMGLNDSYSAVRSQILMMIPLPTHTQACSMIQNEEKQRGLHANMGNTDSAVAFYSQGSPGTNRITMGNTSRGGFNNMRNSSRGGFNNQTNKKNSLYCDNCEITGHSRETCYKLNGYPPNYFSRGRGRRGGNNNSRGTYNNTSANNVNSDQNQNESSILGSYNSQSASDLQVNQSASFGQSNPPGSVFTPSQYQQIMQMIAGGNQLNFTTTTPVANTSNLASTLAGSMDWQDKGDW